MGEFRFNPAIIAELERSPQMAAMLDAVAKEKAEKARRIAPVGGADDPHPGQFRDSIHGEVVVEGGKPRGRVVSDDEDAPYIIFGTSDTPAHDTLRRAVEGL